MENFIKIMLDEKIITKDDVLKLVKSRPPKKISLASLLSENIVSASKVNMFLAEKIRQGIIRIEEIEEIEETEDFDATTLYQYIAKELGMEYIDLNERDIDIKLVSKIPYKQLLQYKAIPVEETDLNIIFVFEDPFNIDAQDMIQRLFPKKPIKIAFSTPSYIRQQLQNIEISESVKGLVGEIRKDLSQDGAMNIDDEDSSAVLKLIDVILKSAIYAGASDIHVEATEKKCVVRERVEGMLRQSFIFDKDIFYPLSSRMKLLANLDIAEKRKPQDGRFSATVGSQDFDFRVSTLPTIHGESIVFRILDKTKAMIRLKDSGMSKLCYERFLQAIKVPYGIVLVTGPTGSGKTTTLYGALNTIKDVKDKTITVEDPVEYQMAGLQQVQVRPNVGLSFAAALKSILRQDPDKIMIGEIRDTETLRIAIQAALTGHLVLSTLHTNDAVSAVIRILDMGIEEYLVSGALVAIQAQRLVRKICAHCKKEIEIEEEALRTIRSYLKDKPIFYKGEGCVKCDMSGYKGREMISEVLTISEDLSRMIARSASKEELEKQAVEEGFVSMFEDGIQKALDGKTTIEEVYRVARL
ncbi:MAG: GspE/PulE family protein [Sulfurovum sp.]|nr:GspE/PulE family protein [Sulfurovum sp.]MCB4779002.1 GspE/PulE family protein [Sulfurovum sp.]